MSWNNIKKLLGDFKACTPCRGTGSLIVNGKITTCSTCGGDGVVKKKTT